MADEDPRLSDEGYVAALTGGVALLFAFFALAGGESPLVVVSAFLAGVLGVGLAVRDARTGHPPDRNDFLPLAALAAIGASVSVPAEQYLTATGLAAVAVMAFLRGYGWRVGEGKAEAEEDDDADADAE